ncbi:MAG: polymer-forming cytoskeletal protein [Deltaproteobacteria bacterium]|nr:polymer-forming cytoskeletal protein [Deltaproteobacteria bacterium]
MTDSNTVVGESILIKGNLEGDEDLTVQGRIEGSINLNKTLIIEPSGVVKAEVMVANAVISGIMVGNISASDSVELTESGRMVGDIQAPRIIITEGALFKGRVDMGDLQIPRPTAQSKPSVASRPAYRPAPVATPAPRPVAPARATAKPAPSVVKSSPAQAKHGSKKHVGKNMHKKKKKVVVKKRR